jgi:hypothetical protein
MIFPTLSQIKIQSRIYRIWLFQAARPGLNCCFLYLLGQMIACAISPSAYGCSCLRCINENVAFRQAPVFIKPFARSMAYATNVL